jgi:glycerol-3-phosphate dehydrogenase (NAD(P)+)
MSEGRIAILGAGAWGSTLAITLVRAGRPVALWAHRPEHAAALAAERVNARYLPGHPFPAGLAVTGDLSAAVAGAPLVLVVVPSQAVRTVARQLAPLLPSGAIIISGAKGLEVETRLRLTAVIAQEAPAATGRIGALSGPNLAGEIAAGQPATSVVAAADPAVAIEARDRLMTPMLRLYTSADVIGVELAGALKNIIALVSGIADGLGAGDNAKAAFMTRGLAEIARLGVAAGAHPLTFAGLAGIGDLIATCASPLSRNRRVGERLASGQSLEAIIAELGHVAEGVATTRAARQLAADLGVEMPITEQLYQVLFAGKPIAAAIQALLARDPRPEMDERLWGGRVGGHATATGGQPAGHALDPTA